MVSVCFKHLQECKMPHIAEHVVSERRVRVCVRVCVVAARMVSERDARSACWYLTFFAEVGGGGVGVWWCEWKNSDSNIDPGGPWHTHTHTHTDTHTLSLFLQTM